ncbi:MAG: glycosyltransferase, partial [Akkermansiaceae bacterium]|nr:glycosyltransferase [Akkermansiaceae bacterium]
MTTRLLLLFLKEPLPGRVKTRLASAVGEELAATIYKSMVRILLQQLSGLEDCHLRVCYAPDDAHDAIRFWLLPEIMDSPDIDLSTEDLDFRPQGGGDLGDRLTRATAAGFEEGFQKIAVIGSDCIEISSRWIHAALAQLNDRHEAVIGPTPDGGYHLLATRRHLPVLFEDIPWSSPATLATTLARAASANIPHYQLPPLPDIDTEE